MGPRCCTITLGLLREMPCGMLPPGVISYHVVFKACAVKHEVAGVECMISLMLRGGVGVSNISHNIVIEACAVVRHKASTNWKHSY